MNIKTKQFLSYIAKQYNQVTITSLMKLSYFIDLVSMKEKRKQISDFVYERYRFGPFNKEIYGYINDLIKEKTLKEKTSYTPSGDEYIIYEFNTTTKTKFDQLDTHEKKIADRVINELYGLGPKALAQIAYETRPMKKIGAKLSNTKGLNKRLDLAT